MITPAENENIKRVLGKHYTKKILNQFEILGIKNTKNEPFSPESIRMIVGGHDENLEIEFQIISFVAKEDRIQKRTLKKRLNLLK